MKAVAYRMRRVLRAQWRATVFLALTVTVVSGVVLTFATGAHRTSSAPDRYTASRGGELDGEIQQDSGRPRTSEIASLPGVVSVEAASFVFGGVDLPGASEAQDSYVFAGSYRAFAGRLVEGRDPVRTGEFVATRSFADAWGMPVGTTFEILTLTQEQADRAGYDAFANEGPQGLNLEAVLVGIFEGPGEINDPTPLALLPASLLDDGDVGIAATVMSLRLRPGTDLARFRAELDSLPGGDTFSLEPSRLISSEVRTAVDAQALGLWLLAAVGGVAAVAVLGQVVTRSVRLAPDERSRLAAIGFTKGQLLVESIGRAAVPIVIGTALGAAVAVGASVIFPTGFVRRIEPHPGLWVDPTVVAMTAAGLLAALMAWTSAALVVLRPARGERPSALVESVAARSGSATLSTGFRFAFTPAGRDRGSLRAAATGMLVTSALLVGAVVFGSSLGRLLNDGKRYGYNFDLMFGSGGDVVPDELRSSLEADPDVAAVLLYAVGQARVGAVSIQLAGMDPVKGDLPPTILSGRLPATENEIALGRLIARKLGTRVGADLTVEGPSSSQQFRVTGLAVVPAVEGLDGMGQDGIVTIGGMRRLDPEATPSVAAVGLRKGAPRGAADRLGGGQYTLPAVLENLAHVRAVPFLLALLVGALAVLTVVHVMITAVRNRRRDLAVLRSLGADGRWITRAVHWQATTFALLPLAIGAPVGIIVGRLVFETFARSIGAVPGASFPFVQLVVVLTGLVVLANAAAAVPARRARHLAPALLLNPE
ncbi:MAG: putative transport system permease protein [Actinomycetota bacterium]|nr:putative transport system permease protein [Actinomycetota bacterium]